MCHVKPFGDDGDQTSSETIISFHALEHGDHLQPRIFDISLFLWLCGLPPHQRCPQIPSFTQTSTPKYGPFFKPLLLIVTFQEMVIKHLMYMQKVPFLYTERACVVFFSFEIHAGRLCVSKKCCKYFGPEGVCYMENFNKNKQFEYT